MKIIQVTGCEDDGYEMRSRIYIKGLSKTIDILEGESEDANLGRDYSDCYKIFLLIKEVYELGKQGVEIEFEDMEDNNIFSENYK